MENNFSLEPAKLQMLKETQELRNSNDFSIKYGLSLSENQIQNLAEKRFAALKDTGRIEFGEGILKKLIYAFCDSPYIHQQNYEDTIIDLQEAFYYFKNETDDHLTDDELIEYMKASFDGIAQGSVEFLTGSSLEELRRNARHGFIDDVDDEKSNDLD